MFEEERAGSGNEGSIEVTSKPTMIFRGVYFDRSKKIQGRPSKRGQKVVVEYDYPVGLRVEKVLTGCSVLVEYVSATRRHKKMRTDHIPELHRHTAS